MLRGFRLTIAAVALVAAASPATAHAFTLIAAAKVTVAPASGLPTAAFTVDGQYGPGPCTIPLAFAFYFDTTINFLTSRTVSACNASRIYDTGNIGGVVPPPSDNAPGAHQVILIVTDTGGNPMPNGTNTAAYTVNAPPPPPPKPTPSRQPPPPPSPVRQSPPSTQPSTSPSTAASPNCPAGAVTPGCPSPSAQACPAAMLPRAGTGGWGDNAIAALMVGAALPIAGLAMVGPGTLLAAAYRRRRFLILFGLSAMAVLALNCTFPTVAGTPQTSPAAAVTPSSAATPSSCSA